MVARGEAWEHPHEGPPDVVVTGDDAALAEVIARRQGGVVRFVPDAPSDLARALGLRTAAPAGNAVTLDALRLVDDSLAVNMVVAGVAPGRLWAWRRRRTCTVDVDDRRVFAGPATTVVVANGQFLDGDDVVPRGHPGDGRLEVQVYALEPGERRAMRRRLATGTHVPHPRIRTFEGRTVRIVWRGPMSLVVDGRGRAAASDIGVALEPAAFGILL